MTEQSSISQEIPTHKNALEEKYKNIKRLDKFNELIISSMEIAKTFDSESLKSEFLADIGKVYFESEEGLSIIAKRNISEIIQTSYPIAEFWDRH